MSHPASSFSQENPHNSLAEIAPVSVGKQTANYIVYIVFKLGLATLAVTAIYLPSLSQAANAANLETQTTMQTSNNRAGYPAFLPRILSLIPKSFNRLVGFADGEQPNPEDKAFLEAQIIDSIAGKDFDCITTVPQSEFSLAADFKSGVLVAALPTSQVGSKTHRVRTGDTLSHLAQEYQVPLNRLSQLNQIHNSDMILVDRQLMIPGEMFDLVTAKNKDRQSAKSVKQNLLKQQTAAELKLVSQKQQTKVLKTSPKTLPVIKTNSSELDKDPYISKLKAEIEQLRAEYRQGLQPEKRQANSRRASGKLSTDNPPQKVDKTTNSVATSISTSSSTKANLFLEDSRALQLPPLPTSEEYLPSAFDGYSWPAQGVLTSGYGWRWGRLHNGIDIAAPVGTPVTAAASGEVISAGWNSGGYGNLIKLQHLDGSVTVYAHNDRILVNSGQRVEQGEQIAEMGNTGQSTGSHLHFEIHPRSQGAVNPLAFLN